MYITKKTIFDLFFKIKPTVSLILNTPPTLTFDSFDDGVDPAEFLFSSSGLNPTYPTATLYWAIAPAGTYTTAAQVKAASGAEASGSGLINYYDTSFEMDITGASDGFYSLFVVITRTADGQDSNVVEVEDVEVNTGSFAQVLEAPHGNKGASSPTTVTFTTAGQAGDVRIITIHTDNDTVTVAPSGYTLIASVFQPTETMRVYAYYKVLTGVDAGESTGFTLSGSANFAWTGAHLRRSGGALAFGTSNTKLITESSSWTTPTLAAGAASKSTIVTVTTIGDDEGFDFATSLFQTPLNPTFPVTQGTRASNTSFGGLIGYSVQFTEYNNTTPTTALSNTTWRNTNGAIITFSLEPA